MNARRTAFKQHKNGKGVFGAMQKPLQDETPNEPTTHDPDEPFPYLEKFMVAVKKYPYTAIGVMIGIASLVIGAVVTVSVAVGGGMFLMYGEMKANTALMTQILNKQTAIEQRQDDDGKVMRAYASVNGKRIEFVIGLLSKESQEKVNQYDRAHPDPLLPDAERKDQ